MIKLKKISLVVITITLFLIVFRLGIDRGRRFAEAYMTRWAVDAIDDVMAINSSSDTARKEQLRAAIIEAKSHPGPEYMNSLTESLDRLKKGLPRENTNQDSP